MTKQISSGKFGLEIPALTKAQAKLEESPYSPQDRKDFHDAQNETSELVKKVQTFLEEKEAILVSGNEGFGVIKSGDDSKYCITFYGPRSLAEAVARAFRNDAAAGDVFSARDGAVVKPTIASVPKQAKQKPGL
jgi:hypothetical protein